MSLDTPLNDPLSYRRQTSSSTRSFPVVALILVFFGQAAVVAVTVYYWTKLNPAVQQAVPLANLDFSKAVLINYRTSGQYDAELTALTSTWWGHFSAIAAQPTSCVVFDIDDTLLSNFPYLVSTNFGLVDEAMNNFLATSNDSLIPQTGRFYNQLKNAGYRTALVTGRPEWLRNATLLNLQKAGISGFTALYMMQPSDASITVDQYKYNSRQNIQTVYGYQIVGCIGDQYSDCALGLTGYAMKVPNNMYFIP